MKPIRPMALVAIFSLLAGCGATVLEPVARGNTSGATVEQIFASARVVLAEKGFRASAKKEASDTLQTEWKRRGNRMIQYEISVVTPSAGHEDGTLKIAVTTSIRDRVLEGWSDAYPARMNSNRILLDTIERVTRHQEAAHFSQTATPVVTSAPQEISPPAAPAKTPPEISTIDGGTPPQIANTDAGVVEVSP